MSEYDDYFTADDKPFIENINDALLISNVFDFTVPIALPDMFSNQTWVNSTSKRKAGVAIVELAETLPNTLSITTANDKSVVSGTGTMKLLFYPNFNSFGQFKAFDWSSSNNNIQVNLKTKTGTTILSNISKGNLPSIPSGLKVLDQVLIEIVFTASDTLTGFTVTMENKQQTRYGANVKISTVDGLQSTIDDIEDDITDLNSYAKNNFILNGHSVDGYYRNKNKIIVDAEPTGLRGDMLYGTNISYPPLRPFRTPIIVNWEEDDVLNYGVATLYCSSSSGKLTIKIIPISANVPSTFRACLNFEYLYDVGG